MRGRVVLAFLVAAAGSPVPERRSIVRGRGSGAAERSGPDRGAVRLGADEGSRAAMKVYTRKGDDGTTGLLYGGRVRKDDAQPRAYGAVDEAQAAIGLARAEAERGGELDALLVGIERDLWVLMTELATAPENRGRLTAGSQRATAEMVTALEASIDSISARFDPPT